MPITKIDYSDATPEKAIAYITDPEKSNVHSVINLNPNEDYAEQINRFARLWNKAQEYDDRKYYQAKICFDPADSDANGGPLTDELALTVSEEIAREFFPGHPCVIAVHNDTNAKHVQIIIGAVNIYTGEMLNLRRGAYRKFKDRANEISAEHGLSAIDWQKATAEKRKREKQDQLPEKSSFAEIGMRQRGEAPWKDELREIIDYAALNSSNISEFRQMLASRGVFLTRCSDEIISYKFGKHKACRGDTLGGDYAALAIRSALRHNRDADSYEVSKEDRALYRWWGRMASMKRSEVDAICDELHQATWCQKQEVFDEFKQIKEDFWSDYRKRKERLKERMDAAYQRRRLIKEAEWLLSPFNKNRCFAGIVFAAIILHQNGSREQAERDIEELRRKQDQLREECQMFLEASDDALQTLRQKGLALDSYMGAVQHMQNVADGMFRQPSEYKAMAWRIERNAYAKAPTLDEYLRMCQQEPKEHEAKENEKELLS